jgi:nickel-dependent lactate racemase
MRISLKRGLWERDHDLLLNLPGTWNVEILQMEGDSRRVLGAGAYRKALVSLEPLLKDKREICVLFDDISRPTRTYQIVPFLLELFDRCGIRDEQVRFLCALGTHGPLDNRVFRKKLGEEVWRGFLSTITTLSRIASILGGQNSAHPSLSIKNICRAMLGLVSDRFSSTHSVVSAGDIRL